MGKAKSYYRSGNLTPSARARWVNTWLDFHKDCPELSRDEWCRYNRLAPTTFASWVKDPRYNRELRKKEKKALQSDPVVQEESKEPLAKDRPSGGLSDEMRLQMIADFYHDQSALGKKPYVVFACDKFRLTISEEMPAKNINMCIGYVKHMVERGY